MQRQDADFWHGFDYFRESSAQLVREEFTSAVRTLRDGVNEAVVSRKEIDGGRLLLCLQAWSDLFLLMLEEGQDLGAAAGTEGEIE